MLKWTSGREKNYQHERQQPAESAEWVHARSVGHVLYKDYIDWVIRGFATENDSIIK